jgi:hypothetical protein
MLEESRVETDYSLLYYRYIHPERDSKESAITVIMSAFVTAQEDSEMERRMAEENAQSRRLVRDEERSPYGRHRWVKLQNLTSKASWNGKYAEIMTRKLDTQKEDDRFGVRVLGTQNVVAIKQINMEAIPDEETLQVCRIKANGEDHFDGGFVQTVRWPKHILQSSPTSYPSHACPISNRLGFPLRVTKVKPRSTLRVPSDYDNQWVTWMMIEPRSGFAPIPWMDNIGPVVVWREDGGDLSANDMCLLNDFLSGLLDQYSEGPGAVDPNHDLTPQVWTRFRDRVLADRAANVAEDPTGMMDSYDNID